MNIFESSIWTNEKNCATYSECFHQSSGILSGDHYISENYKVQPSHLSGWIYRWSHFLPDFELHFVFSCHQNEQGENGRQIGKYCWHSFLCGFAMYFAGGLYCEHWCSLMWILINKRLIILKLIKSNFIQSSPSPKLSAKNYSGKSVWLRLSLHLSHYIG